MAHHTTTVIWQRDSQAFVDHRAHESCFIASSVKTQVLCEPIVETETRPLP